MEFYIVDAFSKAPFGGNPAGVVVCNEEPLEETMQKIAAEVRFSETAFLTQLNETSFKVRFFTPCAEVDLCGHATISTFEVLRMRGSVRPGNTYKMHTKAGALSIYVNDDSIMMEQGKPERSNLELDIKELCETLNISQDVVGVINGSLKPEIVSTGLWDIMFPVKTLEALNRIEPDFSKLSILSEKYNVVGLHAFTLEDNKHTACCRNFAPLYAINEEAATGTSNGALTYYLYSNNLIAENTINTFLQGEKMGRPSIITTTLVNSSEGIKVLVGGTSKILVKGELFL